MKVFPLKEIMKVNAHLFIYSFHSDLVFPAPEVIQSDCVHCTVVTKFAPEHFLQNVNQVHVVHCIHGIVVVKV